MSSFRILIEIKSRDLQTEFVPENPDLVKEVVDILLKLEMGNLTGKDDS